MTAILALALMLTLTPPASGASLPGPGANSTPFSRSSTAAVSSTSIVSGSRAQAANATKQSWVTPVPAMEIITAFDPPDKPWLKGHRGIDVLAVEGEPLRAPTKGTIRFAGTVAGMATVSILTASGHVLSFQPVTTDLRQGEDFEAGERIGEVGSGSHCEQSCLHIGAWPADSDKRYIDPGKLFGQETSLLLPLSRKPAEEPKGGGDSTTSGAGAWGGHSNGRIPTSAMCQLKTAPGQMLRCDAQAAFDRLSHAFEARFGAPISVTDAYRDYATQVILKRRKGRMAATPGTSNHGWALAVDLGSGINSFGTAQHEWMRENAPKFGWIHPGWARQSGSLPEPWHWEFRK
ncbi:D-alanyl-D-alanine carboxypeptidase family protein [Brevibacterium oceani]|uniref:D-alanyl-D-alanine carboxypeptidase family protein n=1 Tax=Brevibacterium oceani TaxID=358099 RepID=UPI002811BA9B|nr:D-alanyl-D-alanine carboxypeptidase family protein [Brevibacterium oceani]